MEKKIPVKTLYLLLVISIGLIGLGIGSTYAVFTSSTELKGTISLGSNLSYNADIIETVEVTVSAGKVVTTTLNVTNSSSSTINYVFWYLDEGYNVKIGTSSSTAGSLDAGGSSTINVDVFNGSSKKITVILGISSSSDSVVLSNNMKQITGGELITSDDFSYDNTNSGNSCNDVTCALDDLYDISTYNVSLELGDYVYYKPVVDSYEVDTTKTGYAEYDSSYTQTINPSELELWRVLNINDDGTVDLISEYVSSTDVYFYGQTGYLNLVGYLNELAKQYETEGITDETNGSRYFGYNGQTEYLNPDDVVFTEAPWSCSTEDSCDNAPVESEGGGDTLYTVDYNQLEAVLGTRVANKVGTSTMTDYWMASRYYYYNTASNYSWVGRFVNTSGSNNIGLLYNYYSSSFRSARSSSALRPIVTLKSGLSYGGGTGTKTSPIRIKTD